MRQPPVKETSEYIVGPMGRQSKYVLCWHNNGPSDWSAFVGWLSGRNKGQSPYCMWFSFVRIRVHESQFEIWCLFSFSPNSINVTESSWKCDVSWQECFKILLHANIAARKAAFARNYFSRHNNFDLHGSHLPPLRRNAGVLFRRVNYLYLATFTCPIVFLYLVST